MFGEVAATYDRVRPGYPDELFERIFSYAGLAPGGGARLVECGAGTGKATMGYARRAAEAGWSLTCVEPDEEMAAVLSGHLSGVPGLSSSVVVRGFEDFAAGEVGEGFSLLLAAQCWHWLSPEHRAGAAAAVLRPGGTLALVWNVARAHDEPLRSELGAAYRSILPEWGGGAPASPTSPQPYAAGLTEEARRRYVVELEATGLFTRPRSESVTWTSRHGTEEWLAVLETHSDHRMLEPETRRRLLQAVRDVVTANGDRVDVVYDTVAVLARRA